MTYLALPVVYDSLSIEERRLVREEYVQRQKGLCCFCHKSLDADPSEKVAFAPIKLSLFPRNFMKFPVHLHHSHETGWTIGAVHARCNAYLWQYLGE